MLRLSRRCFFGAPDTARAWSAWTKGKLDEAGYMDWDTFKQMATRRFAQLGLRDDHCTDEGIFILIEKRRKWEFRYTSSFHRSGRPCKIRAIQGHSAHNAGRDDVEVNVPITSNDVEQLWHFTTEGAYRRILKFGLLQVA